MSTQSVVRAVVALCFAIAVLDGFDIQSLGVAAPKLAPEFGLSPAQMGRVFTCGTLYPSSGIQHPGRIIMMKFILAGRRKPQDTQEKYFYEWGIIHVALMITTPSVMRSFRRYVQHYSINGVADSDVMYPFSPMAWDKMTDHWINEYADLVRPFEHADYLQRMQPHNFGDAAFALEMARGDVVYEMPNFTSGGVKLIHFIKKRPEMLQQEFAHGGGVCRAGRATAIRRFEDLKMNFDKTAGARV